MWRLGGRACASTLPLIPLTSGVDSMACRAHTLGTGYAMADMAATVPGYLEVR